MFLFTVVHQEGELMKSQRAVGRHTEEGEELTGAWKTKGDTGEQVMLIGICTHV